MVGSLDGCAIFILRKPLASGGALITADDFAAAARAPSLG